MNLDTLPPIPAFDNDASARARRHQAELTKPPGSLGRLEELSVFYAGAKGAFPVPTPKRCFIPVFGADHGVTAEGVSAFPAHLTTPILQNVVHGGAGICVLARQYDIELLAVDVGMTSDLVQSPAARVPALTHKIRRGTRNLKVEDAMTREEGEAALRLGVQIALAQAKAAVELVGVGEVGIGNTTASAALIAAFTGRSPEEVTGTGTGIDAAGRARKVAVVEQALARSRSKTSSFELACALGGLEILAMAGFMIGAASERIPVVLDGVIASAAAVVAHSLRPSVERYFVAAHRSTEPGMTAALEFLSLSPLIDLGMRLGEGTGSAIGISLVRTAVATCNEMATFASASLT